MIESIWCPLFVIIPSLRTYHLIWKLREIMYSFLLLLYQLILTTSCFQFSDLHIENWILWLECVCKAKFSGRRQKGREEGETERDLERDWESKTAHPFYPQQEKIQPLLPIETLPLFHFFSFSCNKSTVLFF